MPFFTSTYILYILTGPLPKQLYNCCDILEVFHTSEKLHNDLNGSYINQIDTKGYLDYVNEKRWYKHTNYDDKWSIWWNKENQYWVIGLTTKKGTDQGDAFLTTGEKCFTRNTPSTWWIHNGKDWDAAGLSVKCRIIN